MPYLNYVFCEECGSPHFLDIDQQETVKEYIKERRSETFINPATLIWDYMIYRCNKCGKKFKYTYRDIEMLVREHFSNLSEEYKQRMDEIIDGKRAVQVIDTRSKTLKRIEERYRARK